MKAYHNLIKISNEEYQLVTINQEEGEVKVTKKDRPESIHHIEIIDRSGSMAGEINRLIDQVQKTHELISDDDIISILWFSSPGQYRTLVKGAKKGDKLDKLLDSIRSVVGCTCFSDPMKEVKTIIEELSSLSSAISVTLFTDGMSCTNEPASVDEHKALEIVNSFADKIVAFNTVGYGNYYNQEFLKSLAALSENGIFNHSRDINEYLSIFKNNFERISETIVEKVKIEFPNEVDGLYLNRKMSKIFANHIYLKKLDSNKNQFFLIKKGKGNFSFKYNGEEIQTKDLTNETAEPTIVNFLYAYAHAKYYLNGRKASLQIIGNTLGDVALIKSHMSAFTYDEVAEHQERLMKAMLNVSCRGEEGYNTNFLPDPNEFCVIDLINELVACDAKYLPYHSDADEYKRIGKKTEESDSKFVWPDGDSIEASMSSLVYNEKRANLSILIPVNGKVKIDKDDIGLIGKKEIPATIFRAHTIIKDGALNVSKMVVKLPLAMIKAIGSKTTKKFMEVFSSEDEAIVRFNLKKLPLMNSAICKDLTASEIYKVVHSLATLECKQKVLNHFFSQYKEGETAAQKKTGIFDGLSAGQIAILEGYGLNSQGRYSPPDKSQKKNADSDSYETREFAFEFVGFGNLPKISDIEKKLAEKKNLTNAESMMLNEMELIKTRAKYEGIDLSKSVLATKNFLQSYLSDVKKIIFSIRAELAVLKMGKLLNGETFEGFADDGKKNMVYIKDGLTLKMIMKRVTEYF